MLKLSWTGEAGGVANLISPYFSNLIKYWVSFFIRSFVWKFVLWIFLLQKCHCRAHHQFKLHTIEWKNYKSARSVKLTSQSLVEKNYKLDTWNVYLLSSKKLQMGLGQLSNRLYTSLGYIYDLAFNHQDGARRSW